jgi:hypothetical protein
VGIVINVEAAPLYKNKPGYEVNTSLSALFLFYWIQEDILHKETSAVILDDSCLRIDKLLLYFPINGVENYTRSGIVMKPLHLFLGSGGLLLSA